MSNDYREVCIKVASNSLKEVDLERMRQEGFRFLAQGAAHVEPAPAPAPPTPEPVLETELPAPRKGRKG